VPLPAGRRACLDTNEDDDGAGFALTEGPRRPWTIAQGRGVAKPFVARFRVAIGPLGAEGFAVDRSFYDVGHT